MDETTDKNKPWKLTEVTEPSQCRCIRLPDSGQITKVLFLNILFSYVQVKEPTPVFSRRLTNDM
jgi:hypothetical protein